MSTASAPTISRTLSSGAWTISPASASVFLEELIDQDDGKDVVAQLGDRPGAADRYPYVARMSVPSLTGGEDEDRRGGTRGSSCSRRT